MQIKTKKIALAAYIKMQTPLVTINGGSFVFNSEIPIDEWEIRYYNSCCYKHDSQVIALRDLKRTLVR